MTTATGKSYGLMQSGYSFAAMFLAPAKLLKRQRKFQPKNSARDIGVQWPMF
jgi:hypothetical protein